MKINNYTLPDTFKWEVIQPEFNVREYTDNDMNWKYSKIKTSVVLEISGDIIEDTQVLSWEKVKDIFDNCVTDNFIDIELDEGTYKGKCIIFAPNGDPYFDNIYHLKMTFVLKSEKYEGW